MFVPTRCAAPRPRPYGRLVQRPRGHRAAPAGSPRSRARHPRLITGQTVGAGHFNQLIVPEQVNSMIERFVATSNLVAVPARSSTSRYPEMGAEAPLMPSDRATGRL